MNTIVTGASKTSLSIKPRELLHAGRTGNTIVDSSSRHAQTDGISLRLLSRATQHLLLSMLFP